MADAFLYVFKDPADYWESGYRLMQESMVCNLAGCRLIRYNGHPACYFSLEGLRRLPQAAKAADPSELLRYMDSLLSAVLAVQAQGFLRCENLDISMYHVLADRISGEIRLIWLPVRGGLYEDEAHFEEVLRANMRELMANRPDCEIPLLRQAIRLLENDTLSLEALKQQLGMLQFCAGPARSVKPVCPVQPERSDGPMRPAKPSTPAVPAGRLRLVSLSSGQVICVNGDSFILGRSGRLSDGILAGSTAVGRQHLRLSRGPAGWMAEDMGSRNGSRLNGRPMVSGVPEVLHAGDILTLADLSFRAEISADDRPDRMNG